MAELSMKDFPADLKRELKARAALEGKTLRELVIEKLQAGIAVSPTLKRGTRSWRA
ncbi:MAG: antitoxin [Acidobacteriota bacterium]|nr:antitoxin [Acidobacteriota bacterium]